MDRWLVPFFEDFRFPKPFPKISNHNRNARRATLLANRSELADEKAQHELTRQQLADFISGSDQREQKLQDKLLALQIELSIATNRLAVAERNQSRTDLHLALTQQLLSDSQKIATEAQIDAEHYRADRNTNLLCRQALNIIHESLDPTSPPLDITSPDLIQHVQELSTRVQARAPPDYFYVLDQRDDYHNANRAYARELRELRTENFGLRLQIARRSP